MPGTGINWIDTFQDKVLNLINYTPSLGPEQAPMRTKFASLRFCINFQDFILIKYTRFPHDTEHNRILVENFVSGRPRLQISHRTYASFNLADYIDNFVWHQLYLSFAKFVYPVGWLVGYFCI